MNPLSLGRVATLSALAAVSLASAAPPDAAFASTPGRLPSGPATMAQLQPAPGQPSVPAPVGEPVEANAWEKIQRLAIEHGRYSAPPAGSRLSRYTRETQSNDPKAEYRHMALHVSGQLREGMFATAMVTFTAAALTATTTQVRVDTWYFSTDDRGRLLKASLQTVTKSRDGKIASGPLVPVDRADPTVAARYAGIIKYWSN